MQLCSDFCMVLCYCNFILQDCHVQEHVLMLILLKRLVTDKHTVCMLLFSILVAAHVQSHSQTHAFMVKASGMVRAVVCC